MEESTLGQRRKKIIIDILNECLRQDTKWGAGRNHKPERWLVILMEEVGEAAEAALDVIYANPSQIVDAKIRLRTELVQSAAVIVQIVEWIDRGCPSE